METLGHDIRYAVRVLGKNPSFTFLAVLTLALGIGANTAIFSVVHAVLLAPLPYTESDHLIRITERMKTRQMNVSYPNYLDWRARNHTLDDLATYNPYGSATLTGVERAELLGGSRASENLFRMLGVQPVVGRTFTADEDRPGAPDVVLISHSLWERQFGKDPDIAGREIILDSSPATIIGVLPPDFRLTNAAVWRPIQPSLNANSLDRANHPGFAAIGRLKPGVTLDEARRDLESIAAALEREYPESNKDKTVIVTSLLDSMVGRVRPALVVLSVAVGFVLLIACANVANVLLARAVDRSREVAVRAALGASRARLARMFLVECLLLALAGGAAGVMLAAWGVDALRAAAPAGILPRSGGIELNQSVLLFSLGASLLAGVVFGLAPLWQVSRTNLLEALKLGVRSATDSRARLRLRWSLVSVQVALSLVLLVGAGLMIRSLVALSRVDPGFRAQGLLIVRSGIPQNKYKDHAGVSAFVEQALEKVSAVPGVESAAAAWPFTTDGLWTPAIQFQDRPRPAGQEPWVQAAVVTPEFFATMKVPLLEGRAFTAHDRQGAPGVAMVSERFAREFYPGENVIGKRVRMPGAEGFAVPGWTEIVGVVGNTLRSGLAGRFTAEIYWPYAQFAVAFPSIIVRTPGEPAALMESVRGELVALDRDVVTYGATPVSDILGGSVADRKFYQSLLGVFAALAAILAAVGIYGVVAYLAAQRTREIGIRMALGAGRAHILAMMLRQGLAPVGAGLALGIAAALGLTRFLTNLLYGVPATDVLTFTSVAAGLAVVALAACWIPARRASRVHPVVALRYE